MYNEEGDNYGRIGFKGKKAVSFMLLCHEGYENIYFRNGTSPLGQSDWTIPQTIQRTDLPLERPKKKPKISKPEGKGQQKITAFFQRNNCTTSQTNGSEGNFQEETRKTSRHSQQEETRINSKQTQKSRGSQTSREKTATLDQTQQRRPSAKMMAKRKKWKKKGICFLCETESEYELHACQCFKKDEKYGFLVCEDCINDSGCHCGECDDYLCYKCCEIGDKCDGCGETTCSKCLNGKKDDDNNDREEDNDDDKSDDSSVWSSHYYCDPSDNEDDEKEAWKKQRTCSSCSKNFCKDCVLGTGHCSSEGISCCHVCKATSCKDCGLFKSCNEGCGKTTCKKCLDPVCLEMGSKVCAECAKLGSGLSDIDCFDY